MDEDAVAGALSRAGVPAEHVGRLAAYGAFILAANRQVNLTGAADADAFAEHILDALTLAADVRGPLVDIGSGNGLPGIPLAIVTGARVVLVESLRKKAAVLGAALSALGLDGEARAERAEDAARDPALRETFFTATARAVASAPAVAELTMPFLAVGGRALLQRGRLEAAERDAVADAAPILGGELVEERVLGGERRVLVLEKRRASSPRFPRRNGIPVKRPLCLVERVG